MTTLCLFCGGDPLAPEHRRRCDGRQGRVEDPDTLPPLIAGIAPATWATSAAAAASVEDATESQRALVLEAIRRAGPVGRTDDELQVILELDGSSERPRRWELWKLHRIRVLHDAHGLTVRRLTRTRRCAVVWIAEEAS